MMTNTMDARQQARKCPLWAGSRAPPPPRLLRARLLRARLAALGGAALSAAAAGSPAAQPQPSLLERAETTAPIPPPSAVQVGFPAGADTGRSTEWLRGEQAAWQECPSEARPPWPYGHGPRIGPLRLTSPGSVRPPHPGRPTSAAPRVPAVCIAAPRAPCIAATGELSLSSPTRARGCLATPNPNPSPSPHPNPGEKLCTFNGKYHLAWSVPMADPSYFMPSAQAAYSLVA